MKKHTFFSCPNPLFQILFLSSSILISCSKEAQLICIEGCPKLGPSTILIAESVQTDSAGWNLGRDSLTNVISFNIQDYENPTSLRLEAEMYSKDEGVTCYVQLYNLDDQAVIAGSEMNNLNATRDTTANLLSSFPSREIRLAVRIRSSSTGGFVFTGRENVLLIH